ncbi:hypothetical protein HanXRQr2_Chr01g0025111 [Helianthus annuus]|uniref:Uncharacterized protein n=1 Tax=Helianthus annuus TaxID=4232 RepID=A0A9K3JX48_HELAN|nr:hypothetical protein HanXRQr2_Chr01g0025111 [Helianthus annuus]KAJ0957186.1 hypothetical protein HanPSC8_Chr01g0024261 [Helianthus annuus]
MFLLSLFALSLLSTLSLHSPSSPPPPTVTTSPPPCTTNRHHITTTVHNPAQPTCPHLFCSDPNCGSSTTNLPYSDLRSSALMPEVGVITEAVGLGIREDVGCVMVVVVGRCDDGSGCDDGGGSGGVMVRRWLGGVLVAGGW